MKLVVNAGTSISEKRGTDCKYFGIDYKKCSFLECDLHIGCVNFYTILSGMTAEQSVINENLK